MEERVRGKVADPTGYVPLNMGRVFLPFTTTSR